MVRVATVDRVAGEARRGAQALGTVPAAVAATITGVPEPGYADPEVVDSGAEPEELDLARDLAPGISGSFAPLRLAVGLSQVGAVHGAGHHPDEHLAKSGLW